MKSEVSSLFKRLSALFDYIEEKYVPKYGKFSVTLFRSENEYFIDITFPKGTWDEYKAISREIKEYMNENGLDDLSSHTLITCLEAFQKWIENH